jgi:hypothetical protein
MDAKPAAIVTVVLAIGLLATGLLATSTVEQPPAAIETSAPTEPTPAPQQPSGQAPDPAPIATPEPVSQVPEPKFARDQLNILGVAIWDAFGHDIVMMNGGVQVSDANFNTKVVTPFDAAAQEGDERPLNVQGSSWVLRVTESTPENGTIWSIVT